MKPPTTAAEMLEAARHAYREARWTSDPTFGKLHMLDCMLYAGVARSLRIREREIAERDARIAELQAALREMHALLYENDSVLHGPHADELLQSVVDTCDKR